ncbi:MAG: nucleoside monophosphate kinase, partial [Chromatiales bacterium]
MACAIQKLDAAIEITIQGSTIPEIPNMRIVLLGPPGCGKSVLATKLSKKYGIPVLNLHQILNDMSNKETELGRLVGELLLACAPIPEELVTSALREPLEAAKEGFILEDFPRESSHAEML